jgi:superfamily II DNA helicase RecQ
VVDFCTLPMCRRQQLMGYFGEQGVQCDRSCDYCVDAGQYVRLQLKELDKAVGASCLGGYAEADLY